MNIATINVTKLDDGIIIKRGDSGGGGGGGGSVTPSAVESDVNFYDYDGTILYSYSASDFGELSEMPALPTQDGLICQGWNWSLEDAQTYVSKYGKNNIGAMYITDDGATRLYIKIKDYLRREIPLYFTQRVANGVEVNWGDGSAAETFSGTTVNTTHTYTDVGEYVISLKPINEYMTIGINGIFGYNGHKAGKYTTNIYKVNVGNNCRLGKFCFSGCLSLTKISISKGTYINASNIIAYTGLKHITIPDGTISITEFAQSCNMLTSVSLPNSLTGFGNYVFSYCSSLLKLYIPSSMQDVGGNTVRGCYCLQEVIVPDGVSETIDCFDCYSISNITIPNTVTTISSSSFYSCVSLTSLKIPNTVTTISSSSFYNCAFMKLYDFSTHTTIPTIGTNCFYNVPTDCKIIVPDALYDEWIVATNWANYASYIIKKSDWDASQS